MWQSDRYPWMKYGKTAAAALLGCVYLFPVYWMIATGLKSTADIFATPPKLLPWPTSWL